MARPSPAQRSVLACLLLICQADMSNHLPPKSTLAAAAVGVFLLIDARAGRADADEFFPLLKAGGDVYSNVTVTAVTATDIYIAYSGGMGNIRLKDLDPGMQKHFQFNQAKAAVAEKQKRQASWLYLVDISTRKAPPPPPPQANEVPSDRSTDANGDIVVPKLYARSFRGQRPPQIIIDQWLNPPPDVTNKFVLVVFWTTSPGPCRRIIPHLNDLLSKFKDRMAVIGLTDERPEDLGKITLPQIDYSVGTDPQARTFKAFELQGIPHAVLIDPKGIVRFEGTPSYLDEDGLEHLLRRYAR